MPASFNGEAFDFSCFYVSVILLGVTVLLQCRDSVTLEPIKKPISISLGLTLS